MSILLRFLGIESPDRPSGDLESLQSIAAELDSLAPERARFFAAFAYLLARVAAADLRVEQSEVAAMERTLVEVADVPQPEANLVVRIARSRVDQLGATENYLVSREFKRVSEPYERVRLLQCLFAVAAADDSITGQESNEIIGIAQELGLSHREALALRSAWHDKLAELRPLANERH